MERLWLRLVQLFRGESYNPRCATNHTIEYCVLNSVNIVHQLPEPPGTLQLHSADTVDIPDEAIDWPVTHLVVTDSPVSSLPENLLILQHLTHLIVVQCQLVNLPLCISTLCQLQLLDVTGNKIKELPETLSKLTNLQKLFVMCNNLKQLPVALIQLPLLEQVEVTGNSNLIWPPMEICEQGIAAIKGYICESLEKQSEREDIFKGTKAYGSRLFHSSREVPSLHSLVLNFLMDHKPNVLNEEPFLPPLMKRQLAYAQDLGNFSTPLSKCSVCLMYFSSEAQFRAHKLTSDITQDIAQTTKCDVTSKVSKASCVICNQLIKLK